MINPMNFPGMPMMNNMNQMPNIMPQQMEEQNQDQMAEVLNIAKIKEGFYIGDKISAISIDVIIQFKITHMINATGNQIMNQWESIGISYLTLNWSEVPNQILFDSKDEIANKIVDFIDGSLLGKGEGLLAHSNKGQDRVCIVVLIYLMKKYKWSLIKSMQFLQSKKKDVEIPDFFMIQLKNFENRLIQRGELTHDIPWEFGGLTDPEEKLLRNTYINGLPVPKVNQINNNIKKARHIMWADTNPYKQSPIELHDVSNDLLLQSDIRPVFVHQSLRPRKSSIKGSNNSNNNYTDMFQNKNNIMMNNNVNNLTSVTVNSMNNMNNNYINNNYFNAKNNNNMTPGNENINLMNPGKYNNLAKTNNNLSNNVNVYNNPQLKQMNNNISSNQTNNIINQGEKKDYISKSYNYEEINDGNIKLSNMNNNLNINNNQQNIYKSLSNPDEEPTNANIINNINRINEKSNINNIGKNNISQDTFIVSKKDKNNNLNIPNMNNYLMNRDEEKNIMNKGNNMVMKNSQLPQYGNNNNQNLFNSSPNFVGNNMQNNMEINNPKMMSNTTANNFNNNNLNNLNNFNNIINPQNDKRFNKAL